MASLRIHCCYADASNAFPLTHQVSVHIKSSKYLYIFTILGVERHRSHNPTKHNALLSYLVITNSYKMSGDTAPAGRRSQLRTCRRHAHYPYNRLYRHCGCQSGLVEANTTGLRKPTLLGHRPVRSKVCRELCYQCKTALTYTPMYAVVRHNNHCRFQCQPSPRGRGGESEGRCQGCPQLSLTDSPPSLSRSLSFFLTSHTGHRIWSLIVQRCCKLKLATAPGH